MRRAMQGAVDDDARLRAVVGAEEFKHSGTNVSAFVAVLLELPATGLLCAANPRRSGADPPALRRWADGRWRELASKWGVDFWGM